MKKQKKLGLWIAAVFLIAFSTAWPVVSKSQTEGPDSSTPSVTATSPAPGATGVTVNQPISVTFSQQMSPASMSANLLLYKPNGTVLSGGITYGRNVILRPAVDLEPNTTYTAKVTAQASDVAGVAVGHAFVLTFTTGASSDTTKPTVTFTNPANAGVGVPTNQLVNAMFSEGMSPGSLTTSTFTVTKPGGAAIAGTVSYASGSVTFKPTYGLKINTHYIATIAAGANDLAHNPLGSNYVWSFDTGTDPAFIRPTVTSSNPAANALLVPIDQKVNATFSEPMNYKTITTGDFFLTWSGGRVLGTVSYFYDATNNVTIASFIPKANLLTNTQYTATITAEAMDLTGNALGGNQVSGNYLWQFTTGTTTGQATVPLGAATNFAVLAAAAITNTSTPTTIT